MEAYTSFAAVYDMFMDNIPYEEWAAYLISLLKEYGIEDGLVLDLGCGTGSLTEILAREGYDMTGIDLSPDMLQIAMEKRAESGRDILYLHREILGESTIAEDREESSFIWDNSYDEEERINEYSLSLFIREKEDLYRKYQETHYQRAYTLGEVKDAIRQAGMEFVAVYDAFTRNAPREDSERIYVIAREKGKTPGEKQR